ncbi:DNA-binding protein [Candidatus Roizmanbacteria bacterium CG_4_9_14_0_2_um_filter_39_13]|uniref:DNA-binding protein n=1 Tax=Candidatus Roizmanbacteria bacterium CG_4_9_14_0_2_um_filter_39_13 TaxID=1974839 RepID=A0A2M8F1A3_9BACT|nr:MAG: DNA-binding protein [Candidatus Roizmanbacteria bacterium CG_4_9_14_0_2_um_filter_39_13]
METYYSTRQVSEMLGVNIITVRRWIDKGLLPAIKLERVLRIKKIDLDSFLEQRRVKK